MAKQACPVIFKSWSSFIYIWQFIITWILEHFYKQNIFFLWKLLSPQTDAVVQAPIGPQWDSTRPWGFLTWNAEVYIHSVLSVERRRVVICVKTSTHIGLKPLLLGQSFTSLATFSIQPLMMWKGVEALRTVCKKTKKNITHINSKDLATCWWHNIFEDE